MYLICKGAVYTMPVVFKRMLNINHNIKIISFSQITIKNIRLFCTNYIMYIHIIIIIIRNKYVCKIYK